MPAVAPDDSLTGFVFADKYRIVRQIGRGGMGVVYEAEHMHLGKRVAIKLMLEKYADDAEAIARFQREALAASRIGNPHIIDVSDIGTAPDGRSFVVMELLTGSPLSQVIEAGPMQPWRAIAIMRQVLRAVGAAHSKGIIHRDLKPDNIFLIGQDDQQDFVKLLDFGISKVVDADEQTAFTKLTTTGVVMGTPLYMAPEQAMGNTVEAAADIYACGVMLYEMLAGKPPFEGATYAVLVAKLLTAEPPHLATMRPGLPVALVNAVHRALEKEPQRRFRSAEQFAASLPGDRTASEIGLAGTLDSGIAVARNFGSRRRRTWPIVALGAALVVAAASVTLLLVAQRKDPAAPTPVQPVVQPPPPVTTPPAITPTTGILELQTSPLGAAITVDDRIVGQSPVIVTLEPGTHRVKAELEGFAVVEYVVSTRPNERSSVVVPLSKTVAATSHRPPVLVKHSLPGGGPGADPGKTVKPPAIGPGKPEDDPTGPSSSKPPSTTGTKPNPY